MIYVFDIESDQPEKDFDHFCGVLEAIEENSPDARIFILVHKMDLVAQEDREAIFDDRKNLIEDSCRSCGVENFHCFGTSIWDETLYKAWSEIVTNLIPNIRLLETQLNKFCKVCDADEVVLFERATFLVISHAQADSVDELAELMAAKGPPPGTIAGAPGSTSALIAPDGGNEENNSNPTGGLTSLASSPGHDSDMPGTDAPSNDDIMIATGGANNGGIAPHVPRTPHFDAHRFEKISNIVKQFKLSCGKAQSQFQGMQVRNSRFSAFIDAFTANTYIMVIVSNPNVHTAATLLNIQNARTHFERFIPRI